LGRRSDSIRRPHQQIHGTEPFLLEPERLPDAALDPVALHGARSVLLGHQDAEPRRACLAALQEETVTGQIASHPVAQQAFELRFLSEPAGRIEPETLAARGYNPRRRRPLARRLRRTARPPRVPLRTRKPWRRARRVLEGW
jgi:hypothetical protein